MTHDRDGRRGEEALRWSVLGLSDEISPAAGRTDAVSHGTGRGPLTEGQQVAAIPAPQKSVKGAPAPDALAGEMSGSGAAADHDSTVGTVSAARPVGSASTDATMTNQLNAESVAFGAQASLAIVRNGPGNETIFGGGAAETLFGGGGEDLLYGGGGSDILYGGTGNDYMRSGLGNDTLEGGVARDAVFGGRGDDLVRILNGEFVDDIFGGTGVDTAGYSGSSAAMTVVLASQIDLGGDAEGGMVVGMENLIGSGFNDVLLGNGLANTIEGGAGSDVISGEGGSDVLFGGAGFDALSGADGGLGTVDTLFGVTELDIAYYFTADSPQVVDLSDHADLTRNSGEHTRDIRVSIEGVYGVNDFSNTLTGDVQDNLFLGGNQADTLYRGGGGSDILTARGGDDALHGGIGNDFLSRDAGNDAIYGGGGEDTFYVFATSGIDVIKDYAGADDAFLFYQTGATQWSDLAFTPFGGNVHITRSGTSFTVIVEGATLANLDNSTGNFIFS